eukprot:GHVU01006025.1.p1 GENE.GHVU01006025.1~~GHVU01006025.1.p1  ORF type:complete len:248 (+),score=52.13 GHVU01006025.1:135-878(+)
MAKGPLPTAGVSLLLVPVHHYPCFLVAPKAAREEAQELLRLLRAQHEPDHDVIVCERYCYRKISTTMHTQIQYYALPKDRGGVRDYRRCFQQRAQQEGLDLREVPLDANFADLPRIVLSESGGGGSASGGASESHSERVLPEEEALQRSYIYLEYPSTSSCLISGAKGEEGGGGLSSSVERRIHFNRGGRLPLSYCRDVLAGDVLQKPDAADWRKCVPSKEEEVRMAAGIRKALSPVLLRDDDGDDG